MKRAAQRKLEHELGIAPASVPLDMFQFLTRIHYLAPSTGLWGEHESACAAEARLTAQSSSKVLHPTKFQGLSSS